MHLEVINITNRLYINRSLKAGSERVKNDISEHRFCGFDPQGRGPREAAFRRCLVPHQLTYGRHLNLNMDMMNDD